MQRTITAAGRKSLAGKCRHGQHEELVATVCITAPGGHPAQLCRHLARRQRQRALVLRLQMARRLLLLLLRQRRQCSGSGGSATIRVWCGPACRLRAAGCLRAIAARTTDNGR
jgi:hypothetical protein